MTLQRLSGFPCFFIFLGIFIPLDYHWLLIIINDIESTPFALGVSIFPVKAVYMCTIVQVLLLVSTQKILLSSIKMALGNDCNTYSV